MVLPGAIAVWFVVSRSPTRSSMVRRGVPGAQSLGKIAVSEDQKQGQPPPAAPRVAMLHFSGLSCDCAGKSDPNYEAGCQPPAGRGSNEGFSVSTNDVRDDSVSLARASVRERSSRRTARLTRD